MASSTMEDNYKNRSCKDSLLQQNDGALEIGILQPHNLAAKESFNEVAQRFEELPEKLQRNIRVKAANTKTQYTKEGDTSGHRDDHSTTNDSYEGHFVVGFNRDEKGDYALECTIGGGDSKFGETRGVSHLVSYPSLTRQDVAAQHVSIRFDSKSGMIAVVPLTKDHPVVIYNATGIKTIHLGEKHLVQDLMTHFAIDKKEYMFFLHRLNQKDLEMLKWLRARAFHRSGLAQPDGRIQPLPIRQPFNRVGSTLIHRMIARGRWADIWSGVNVDTGEILAVKQIVITEPAHHDFLDEEVKINLDFPAHAGLLQAQDICDDMGHTFGPGQADACLNHFRQLEFPHNMNITMAMMENDVTEWWSSLPRSQQRYQDAVEVFRIPAETIARFHEAGYILRGVSAKNTFKKKGALAGMLGDHGLVIHATTDTLQHLGPIQLRAPECDGSTVYTNKIDVYSFGMAMLCLLYPEIFTDEFGFNETGVQRPGWYMRIFDLLDYHAIDSDTHLVINRLLKIMIHPKEGRRPAMAWVVKDWPTYKPARRAKKSSASAAGPNGSSAKRVKMDYNGGYVQTGL